MKTAALFQDGDCQVVRLPKEYRFEGDEVLIGRMGKAVVLLPEEDSWDMLVWALDIFSDDFMDDRQQPGQQGSRESL